jgi:hypothetical protein
MILKEIANIHQKNLCAKMFIDSQMGAAKKT